MKIKHKKEKSLGNYSIKGLHFCMQKKDSETSNGKARESQKLVKPSLSSFCFLHGLEE